MFLCKPRKDRFSMSKNLKSITKIERNFSKLYERSTLDINNTKESSTVSFPPVRELKVDLVPL